MLKTFTNSIAYWLGFVVVVAIVLKGADMTIGYCK